MLQNKKIILGVVAILVCLAIVGGAWYGIKRNNNNVDTTAVSTAEYDSTLKEALKLKTEKPELSSLVDDIEKYEKQLKDDQEKIQNYLSLGLAWKSLAEQTRADVHFKMALLAYERGVTKSDRKNTILLVNAGNMNIYLKNYAMTEKYFKEALMLSPGDTDLYVRLLDLYSGYMSKSQEDMKAVIDSAEKSILNTKDVEQLRKIYLK